MLLKSFELEARSPRSAHVVPRQAVACLAQQVRVPAVEFAGHDWSGRTIEHHRAQIRKPFGFRESRPRVQHPDETVRAALYPVWVRRPFRDLVREAKANERAFRPGSAPRCAPPTPNHYRRLLPPLLAALEFRCNGPDAIVPIEAAVPTAREAVVDEHGHRWRDPEADFRG